VDHHNSARLKRRGKGEKRGVRGGGGRIWYQENNINNRQGGEGVRGDIDQDSMKKKEGTRGQVFAKSREGNNLHQSRSREESNRIRKEETNHVEEGGYRRHHGNSWKNFGP